MSAVEKRFWSKVDKTGGCWLWTASKSRGGYGKFKMGGSMKLAHRVSYEFAHGPIPAGMQVDHACHQRACINPEHLRLVNNAANSQNRSKANLNSKSGIRGVNRFRNAQWQAYATLDGKKYHLGTFGTLEAAEAAVVGWRHKNMPWSVLDRVVPLESYK